MRLEDFTALPTLRKIPDMFIPLIEKLNKITQQIHPANAGAGILSRPNFFDVSFRPNEHVYYNRVAEQVAKWRAAYQNMEVSELHTWFDNYDTLCAKLPVTTAEAAKSGKSFYYANALIAAFKALKSDVQSLRQQLTEHMAPIQSQPALPEDLQQISGDKFSIYTRELSMPDP